MGTMIPTVDHLYTNRLVLRKVQIGDLDILQRWSSSAAAYGEFLSPEQYDRDELEQRFATGVFWNQREKLFQIAKRQGPSVGTIHYWLPADKMDTATVAVKIAEPGERNRGYGTEAQKFLLIYLFEKEKIRRVEMYTDLDNKAQQRCLQKLGFTLMETLTYDDRGIRRTGNCYRLERQCYRREPIYRYHYE